MKRKRFGPLVFIPGENRGKYPFCHSVYIEEAGVLIDPASDRQTLIHLKETSGVQAIWLSHAHEDHFMHLDLFDAIPLYISEEDAPGISDLDVLMDYYGLDDEFRDFWREYLKKQFHFRPRKPTGHLHGGDIIDLGPITVEVISTPGHTPGHLSFFFRETEVLFMGDYDLTRFGPWYGDVYSSIEQTIASISRLRDVSAKVWITSHETGVLDTKDEGLWDRYLNVITEREQKLIDLLKYPRTLEDIVKACIIYGKPREPRAFFEFGERVHMRKHLERLKKKGAVQEEKGRYYRL